MKKRQRGFTLIELLVFMNIISIVFIMVMSLSTALLKSAKSNENKTYATHYAQETSEWLLSQSQIDWATFVARAPTPLGTNTNYCFNTSPLTTWNASVVTALCTTYTLGGKYKRDVTLTPVAPLAGQTVNQVMATITISWKEGTNVLSVPVVAVFNNVRN